MIIFHITTLVYRSQAELDINSSSGQNTATLRLSLVLKCVRRNLTLHLTEGSLENVKIGT